MSSCFTCGKGFKGSVNELLALKKRDYEEHGAKCFYYKLQEKGDILIAKMSDFNRIFNDKIKPNFNKGAEYALIQEYNPKDG